MGGAASIAGRRKKRQAAMEGKAMVVTMSRDIANCGAVRRWRGASGRTVPGMAQHHAIEAEGRHLPEGGVIVWSRQTEGLPLKTDLL
ncbi:hypothetical protein BMS3Bbin12_00066 [bacterium BMS3Bbin12]|nr:hypothetical protein BMS3Bbin12_00066 [bacterium BMS3Bbin12]GBE50618.1 hypothetical protein BMS3Bbin13_01558 [bacterium BMS3Bbin13]